MSFKYLFYDVSVILVFLNILPCMLCLWCFFEALQIRVADEVDVGLISSGLGSWTEKKSLPALCSSSLTTVMCQFRPI